ncbi:GL12573 [Drosophila persimilis]|uniref:GL12573 n=1 Tax=Drosophila persimilis TaxID=7234 RepID=B4GLI4_DROPE|nr:GL12573 [Drosophila persimilis]
MVYLNLIIGIVTVLVTAGFAVYMSQPTYQTEPPHQSLADLCPLCQIEMSSSNMHRMQCGHALHNDCFQEFRFLRRSCPAVQPYRKSKFARR